MRLSFTLILVAFATTLAFIACNRSNMRAASVNDSITVATPNQNVAPSTAQTPSDGAARIPIPDARKEVESGKAVFVDVRDSNSYKAGHIKGAINIPLGEIPSRLNEFPRDKKIIAYCS